MVSIHVETSNISGCHGIRKSLYFTNCNENTFIRSKHITVPLSLKKSSFHDFSWLILDSSRISTTLAVYILCYLCIESQITLNFLEIQVISHSLADSNAINRVY